MDKNLIFDAVVIASIAAIQIMASFKMNKHEDEIRRLESLTDKLCSNSLEQSERIRTLEAINDDNKNAT